MRQVYPNELYGVGNEGTYLQHWKYIRKYKNSSGKWRYVYNDSKKSSSSNGGIKEIAVEDTNTNPVESADSQQLNLSTASAFYESAKNQLKKWEEQYDEVFYERRAVREEMERQLATKSAQGYIKFHELSLKEKELNESLHLLSRNVTLQQKAVKSAKERYEKALENDKSVKHSDEELYHFGINGQKWGVRRFQNPDGSLTSAGRERYMRARQYENMSDEYKSSGHFIKAAVYKNKHKKAMEKVNAKDEKWLNKQNYQKQFNKTSAGKETISELDALMKEYKKTGEISRTSMNRYNQNLAEALNENLQLTAPSGRIVQWVAKRGEIGVMTGFADAGYDMNKLKRGVWTDGRIAYRKDMV